MPEAVNREPLTVPDTFAARPALVISVPVTCEPFCVS
jgi:hypothetical protein